MRTWERNDDVCHPHQCGLISRSSCFVFPLWFLLPSTPCLLSAGVRLTYIVRASQHYPCNESQNERRHHQNDHRFHLNVDLLFYLETGLVFLKWLALSLFHF